MKTKKSLATLLGIVTVTLSHGVFAQDPFTQALPMQSDYLDTARGGFEVQNDLQLRATVAQNSASHIRSGNNVIAEGAFANASGMPMVVQNSGSNVLIQNATVVHVHFQ